MRRILGRTLAVAGVVALGAWGLQSRAGWPLREAWVGSAGAWLLVVAVTRSLGLHRAGRLRRRLGGWHLKDLDRLDGSAFEDWVRGRLEAAGFQVTQTPRSGDFGVDLVAQGAGLHIAVEVKRRDRKISNRAVRSAIAGCRHYGCDLAAVITQAGFTAQARRQAEGADIPVLLLGRKELPRLARHLWAHCP